MNSGAYGSYPRKYKKRSTKKYTRRTTRSSGYNQYTFKKSRIGRLTKTNLQSVICTFQDSINLLPSTQVYTFDSNAHSYLNLTAILAGSPEFVSRQAQYSYYMITGMSVVFTRRWIDPITYGVNGVSSGLLQSNFSNGFESLDCNFYPNLSSGVVGQAVQDADSSFKISPFIHGAQKHYQPFPKNLSVGNNAQGLGVWNAANNYANLLGELAIYNPGFGVATSSTVGPFFVWDIEVQVYCSFCNNTGA